ncbi:DcuS/MalK family sensor histidine kinase [Methylomusa anaerophila]|uniref:histidine kinase n=1 Tax=Methylomusa anaerophila TaxID=1930071 RepID=A0A348AI77_9FIRM|nr:DcuS/MalK family sensor histidine kinase [Methylomusa anaerophila]BBB90775.1 sensor histidine kinase DcuS [Methylomusa anaerophila]
MRLNKPRFKLRTKITILVCGVVALSLLVTNLLISSQIATATQQSLTEKATDIARMVAHSAIVVEALNGQRDQGEIQALAIELQRLTNVEFIVVIDMNRIRKSHPDVTKIGQSFVGGDEAAVLEGREYISTAEGTLGKSLRAFTPVYTPEGKQVGAVVVGILLNSIQQAVAQSRLIIYLAVCFGLAVGVAGAILLAGNIKKTLFGLEPIAIASLLEERSAMLQSVREGIIAVDKDSRITLVNAEALRLLQQAGITLNPIGKDVEAFVPNTRLRDVLTAGTAELDQEQDMNGITLLTNRVPVCVDGEIVGAIATFRDETEIRQLAEQLTGVRNYAEALRAQTHEFMNKLHVILGMVRLEYYDQLAAYITQTAQQYQADVGYVVERIKNPVLAGFLLGKLSRAREAGVDLVLSESSFLPEPADSETVHHLVTIVGNLVKNAFEAVASADCKRIGIQFDYSSGFLTIEVNDTGPGIAADDKERIFAKGYSTKPDNWGLGLFLVQRTLEKLKGQITVVSEPGKKRTRFIVTIPYQRKGEAND